MENYDRNKLVWDLEVCKNIDLLKYASNIVLYGAGGKGSDVIIRLKRAGIFPSFFIDLDEDKCGSYKENVKIILPFQLDKAELKDGYVYIIACIEHPKEVMDLFDQIHLNNVRIITYWGIKMALYVNRKYLYENCVKEMMLLDIEKERRKNRFLNAGYEQICSLVSYSENTIWILQPGKTASTSLEQRLGKNGVAYKKMHKLEYPRHLLGDSYKKIWEENVSEMKKGPLKIIVAVREPIARDFSAFWQAFSEENEMAMETSILDKDFQKTYDRYINILLKGNKYMKDVLGASLVFSWGSEFEWFDEQIKKYLDIDVFQYPFDREMGYTIVERGGIKLFLYKIEKMESILNKISSFVGTRKLPPINDNVGEKKWYGLAYKQFRKEVKIPREYVEYYYKNSKMDYFYTSKEKEEFLDKWRENIV